jgi:hypothetical protein
MTKHAGSAREKVAIWVRISGWRSQPAYGTGRRNLRPTSMAHRLLQRTADSLSREPHLRPRPTRLNEAAHLPTRLTISRQGARVRPGTRQRAGRQTGLVVGAGHLVKRHGGQLHSGLMVVAPPFAHVWPTSRRDGLVLLAAGLGFWNHVRRRSS